MMNWKRNRSLVEKQGYRGIQSLLIAAAVLFSFGGFLGIRQPGMVHLAVAVPVWMLYLLFVFLEGSGRLLFGAGSAAFLGAAVWKIGAAECLAFGRTYLYWLLGVDGYMADWQVGYECLQTAVIVLLCCLLQLLCEKQVWIMILTAVCLTAGAAYCLFARIPVSKPGLAFLMTFLLFVLTELVQRHWEKIRKQDHRAHMVFLAPFLTLYFLFLLYVPSREEPYDWKFVKETFQKIQESSVVLSQNLRFGWSDDYDLSLSGFSRRSSLTGNLKSDEKEQMTVQTGNRNIRNIYLTGNVYHRFAGREWEFAEEDHSDEQRLDTLETIYAIARMKETKEEAERMDYLHQSKVTVRYRYFKTSHLFLPLKSTELTWKEKEPRYDDRGGYLMFDSAAGYGTEYEAGYYLLNQGSDAFLELLEAPPEDDPEILEDVLWEYRLKIPELSEVTGLRELTELASESLEQYRRKIKEKYWSPVLLSQEVQQYLAEVTQGAGSRIEKLYRIEEALSQLVYTEDPGALPGEVTDEQSFLDYFLLEKREGYCSYFATAFALLARAEGFPTRYVQGFCVPVRGNAETRVYSSMAHAWPEVYIEGVGWIPFEPTPGYRVGRYNPWKTTAEKSAEKASLTGEFQPVLPEPMMPVVPDAEVFVPEEPEEDPGLAAALEYVRTLGKMLLLVIIGAFVLCLLVLNAKKLWRRFRYQKQDVTEKFLTEVTELQRLLAWLGYARRENETIAEWKERILETERMAAEAAKQTPEPGWLNFLDRYEDLIYGNGIVTKQWLLEIWAERKQIEGLLKERKQFLYIYYMIAE